MCQNDTETGESKSLFLVRFDDLLSDLQPKRIELKIIPKNKNDLFRRYSIPKDSVIKIKVLLDNDNQSVHIPWSLLPMVKGHIELQVWKQHQNIKPKNSQEFAKETVIREKVLSIEKRISSLEMGMDQRNFDFKAERDLQLLTKQIHFLNQRVEEAEEFEWIRKNPNQY